MKQVRWADQSLRFKVHNKNSALLSQKRAIQLSREFAMCWYVDTSHFLQRECSLLYHMPTYLQRVCSLLYHMPTYVMVFIWRLQSILCIPPCRKIMFHQHSLFETFQWVCTMVYFHLLQCDILIMEGMLVNGCVLFKD